MPKCYGGLWVMLLQANFLPDLLSLMYFPTFLLEACTTFMIRNDNTTSKIK